MTTKEELQILKRACEKALANNWHPVPVTRPIVGVEISYDPEAIVVLAAEDIYDEGNFFFTVTTPMLDTYFAPCFFGEEYTGDLLTGDASWRFYQHRLLSFWQQGDRDLYVNFLESLI